MLWLMPCLVGEMVKKRKKSVYMHMYIVQEFYCLHCKLQVCSSGRVCYGVWMICRVILSLCPGSTHLTNSLSLLIGQPLKQVLRELPGTSWAVQLVGGHLVVVLLMLLGSRWLDYRCASIVCCSLCSGTFMLKVSINVGSLYQFRFCQCVCLCRRKAPGQ